MRTIVTPTAHWAMYTACDVKHRMIVVRDRKKPSKLVPKGNDEGPLRRESSSPRKEAFRNSKCTVVIRNKK